MTKANKQPVIGIVPVYDEGAMFIGPKGIPRLYLRREYTEIIASVGAIPIVLSPDMPLAYVTDLCDGIVIGGGQDIHPKFYGQVPINDTLPIEPDVRFLWEKELLEQCERRATPILGICYGMQLLNVYYGGTLLQDIDTLRPDNIGHMGTLHHVTFHGDFLGMKATGVHEINSRHHQAIDVLADGFIVKADAPDGIIEAIEGHGHYGMQWHPESDATGAHIYRAFVEACAKQ